MTIAELIRLTESKKRVEQLRAQEQAAYHYILADMIGRSIARLYSSSAKLPDIAEMYPAIFSKEEIEKDKIKRKQELSALRFKQFAKTYNNNFNKGGKGLNG